MEHIGLGGFAFEDLKEGMEATVSRTITETDLRNFSSVSGDTNPMHLNEEFASKTVFGGCIVHGMLTASLIPAAIGTKLPGPGCIYMSQTIKFLAPVRVGDTVYAVVRIVELNKEKHRARMSTTCMVKSQPVIEGEALIKVPTRDELAKING